MSGAEEQRTRGAMEKWLHAAAGEREGGESQGADSAGRGRDRASRPQREDATRSSKSCLFSILCLHKSQSELEQEGELGVQNGGE